MAEVLPVMYGIRNCDTIKKARAWLEQHSIPYQFHDYKKQGVDRLELTAWVAELGWEQLISPLLLRGELQVIPPHVLPAPQTFYLICKPSDELTSSARMLRDWIIAEARKITDEPS